MPLLLLAFLLVDLLSVGFIVLDVYLWREWYEYRDTIDADYAERCLYGAIALLVIITFGKFLLPRLLSKARPKEDQPHSFDTNQRTTIQRPDGSIIHVEYYGKEDAQALVFVHGWNATIDEWYYQRQYFEKNYRLIMMDLPGLGKSKRPSNKDFSLSKMALDLQAVIEHSGARHPILWGHSIGGMTILTLLAKHYDALKQPIKGVILQHTTFTNPVKTSMLSGLLTALQKPLLTPLCYLIIYLSPIMWLSRWMSYLNGNTHVMSRFLTFAGTQTYRQLDFVSYLSTIAPPAVTARGVLGMFQYDVTAQLPALTVPALLLAADTDRLTKPEASAYMQRTMPQAQLVTLSPAGHQGLLERHAETNAAAERFIQSLTQVPGTTTLEEEDLINQQDRF